MTCFMMRDVQLSKLFNSFPQENNIVFFMKKSLKSIIFIPVVNVPSIPFLIMLEISSCNSQSSICGVLSHIMVIWQAKSYIFKFKRFKTLILDLIHFIYI